MHNKVRVLVSVQELINSLFRTSQNNDKRLHVTGITGRDDLLKKTQAPLGEPVGNTDF